MVEEREIRILVCIENFERATRVLRAATEMSRSMGARLVFMHVISDRETDDMRVGASPERAYADTIAEDLEARLGQRIQDVVGYHVLPGDVQIVSGEPDKQILKALEKHKYTYGVIGIENRSRVGKLVFGSTAHSILMLAPCPILAVSIASRE